MMSQVDMPSPCKGILGIKVACPRRYAQRRAESDWLPVDPAGNHAMKGPDPNCEKVSTVKPSHHTLNNN